MVGGGHAAFPQDGVHCDLWLDRYARFAIGSGFDPAMARSAHAVVAASLNCLDPAQDEEILRAGGFDNTALFYTAFPWRGWICSASSFRCAPSRDRRDHPPELGTGGMHAQMPL